MLRQVHPLLTNVLTTGIGEAYADLFDGIGSFQGSVDGTGAVSATILVKVSNDGVHFDLIATITLSGTTAASDGFTTNCSFKYVRGEVSAISGTGAKVNLTLSDSRKKYA